MQVFLLFGFLGSGKTTLARRLIAQSGGVPTAVIVNEFGDAGIDGEILRGNNVDMVELSSGCVCCSMKGPLLQAIGELGAKRRLGRVIVEASGLADPREVLASLQDGAPGRPVRVVTVVDAGRFEKLERMLGEFYRSQIWHADVVILNKVDTAAEPVLARAHAVVCSLNETAAVVAAERCNVDGEAIFAANSTVRERQVAAMPHWHPAAESFVLDASGEHELRDVERFFSSLPTAVWRAKGFMRIGRQRSLVQYSMGRLEITRAPAFGHVEIIVFIGQDMDRPHIEQAFLRRS